jgi:hypothetical protein
MKSLSRIAAPVLLIATAQAVATAAAQSGEYVTVQKVMDDQAIVIRSNGATYLIENGVGCLSLWRYEGKRVVVSSPGLFLGVGSKLIIPDLGQECRIWNSKQVEPPRSAMPQTAPPSSRELGASRKTDEFSFFDSRGQASAYLDLGGDLTFFLWSGEPVAYLVEESIYGFNGKHLGWYRDGMVFDHDGDIVAAPSSAFRMPVEPAPIRRLKGLKPLKGLKELRPLKPLFGRTWSDIPARVFFLLGVD